MLSPEIKEKIVGLAEVRDVFRSPKFGSIAGCMVIDGFVKRKHCNNANQFLFQELIF
jgi:translation initiation factor IF-2